MNKFFYLLFFMQFPVLIIGSQAASHDQLSIDVKGADVIRLHEQFDYLTSGCGVEEVHCHVPPAPGKRDSLLVFKICSVQDIPDGEAHALMSAFFHGVQGVRDGHRAERKLALARQKEALSGLKLDQRRDKSGNGPDKDTI